MGIYLGLNSGTSMDAIDAVLVDFDVAPLRIIATGATSFEPALKRRISALIERADSVALDEVGQIDVELARAFAQAARKLMHSAGINPGRVTAIGSHGQTLRHRPGWQQVSLGHPGSLVGRLAAGWCDASGVWHGWLLILVGYLLTRIVETKCSSPGQPFTWFAFR